MCLILSNISCFLATHIHQNHIMDSRVYRQDTQQLQSALQVKMWLDCKVKRRVGSVDAMLHADRLLTAVAKIKVIFKVLVVSDKSPSGTFISKTDEPKN